VSEQHPPKAREQTAREALREALLTGEPRTARELSVELSLREREVVDHLAHLERSLAHSAQRLEIEPARCLACGFAFEDRSRLSKPGRCPDCKSTRISLPRFHIAYD
jgi:transcriptional regulator